MSSLRKKGEELGGKGVKRELLNSNELGKSLLWEQSVHSLPVLFRKGDFSNSGHFGANYVECGMNDNHFLMFLTDCKLTYLTKSIFIRFFPNIRYIQLYTNIFFITYVHV